jgi:hypothetical protein
VSGDIPDNENRKLTWSATAPVTVGGTATDTLVEVVEDDVVVGVAVGAASATSLQRA